MFVRSILTIQWCHFLVRVVFFSVWPHSVMGHVLNASQALLMGDHAHSSPFVTEKLQKLYDAQNRKQTINEWERMHIEAVEHLASG